MTKQRLFDLSKEIGMPNEAVFTGVVSNLTTFAQVDRNMTYQLANDLKAHLETSIVAPRIPLFSEVRHFDKFEVKCTVESNDVVTQQLHFVNDKALSVNLSTLTNGAEVEFTGKPSVMKQDYFAAYGANVVKVAQEAQAESSCLLVNFLHERNEEEGVMFALVARNAATNPAHNVHRSPKYTNSHRNNNDVLVGITFAKSFSEAMADLDTKRSVHLFTLDCLMDDQPHYTGAKHNDLANLEIHVIHKNSITPWGSISSHIKNNLD
ncbi:hypothetical protein KW882_02490 [Vibrio parahaemolyticus]